MSPHLSGAYPPGTSLEIPADSAAFVGSKKKAASAVTRALGQLKTLEGQESLLEDEGRIKQDVAKLNNEVIKAVSAHGAWCSQPCPLKLSATVNTSHTGLAVDVPSAKVAMYAGWEMPKVTLLASRLTQTGIVYMLAAG